MSEVIRGGRIARPAGLGGSRLLVAATACAIATVPSPLHAQQPATAAEVAVLREQIEAITREIETLRLGGDVAEANASILGFGPAASKVYQVGRGVSIGGYGEIVYENFAEASEDGAASGRTNRLDALRGIVYVGYKFDDRILFNSEIEIEHGSTDLGGGYASLEFAYIDYRFSERVGLRAGLLLAPVGLVNELHEPPIFLGTIRPLTESRLIPTTWRENGIGFFGDAGNFSWRAYVMNSFNGAGGAGNGATGFSGAGLRGGRQKGASASAADLGLVGRVDYTGVLGLLVGGSAFYGETAQDKVNAGEEVGGAAFIWEGHADYRTQGLQLRGLVAGASVTDVVELNALRGLTGNQSIGQRLLGWYVQAGYDLLWNSDSEHQVVPYARYEALDTQGQVPDGFARNPANDVTVLTVGAEWKPIPSVVFKTDYQIHSNGANTGVNQFNLALGYLF